MIDFGDGALLVLRAVFKTVVGQINAVLGGFDSYASPILSSEDCQGKRRFANRKIPQVGALQRLAATHN